MELKKARQQSKSKPLSQPEELNENGNFIEKSLVIKDSGA